MTPSEIAPFSFPTTVALVDDNPAFLANISLTLSDDMAFQCFQSPIEALALLNTLHAKAGRVQTLIATQHEDSNDSHHVIDLCLSMIHREVHNDQRFAQCSVLVVDHDMPEMNGLEMCRRLANPHIKKILLTGKADERVAVQAFNEGLIDRFVRKQQVEVMAHIGQTIAELQQAYLLDWERMLSDALSVGAPHFLKDPAFARHFAGIRARYGIVEHYLTCQPDGLLMLDAAGTPYLLVVQSETRMRTAVQIAEELAAPAPLLAALKGGRYLAHFWKSEGNYSHVYEADWQTIVHPASAFQGQDWYLYSLIKSPPGFKLAGVASYAQYLEQLDATGRDGPVRR